MDLAQIERVAAGAAREAGEIIRSGADKLKTVTTKSSEVDLLTEYDEAVDRLLTDRLLSAFPEHRLFSEEGRGGKPSAFDQEHGLVWHIDPIDGTINFVHGYPVYAVSLALYMGNRPMVAVIYDPSRDECFSAQAGQGAWLRTGEGVRQLQVSKAGQLLDSLLATGFAYDRHRNSNDNLSQVTAILKRVRGIRRSGAAAIDLAYVAAGRLDGYWELRLSSWDVAAGVLLVTEAGGMVTKCDGTDFQLRPEISIAASNGAIHRAMIDVLNDSAVVGAQ